MPSDIDGEQKFPSISVEIPTAIQIVYKIRHIDFGHLSHVSELIIHHNEESLSNRITAKLTNALQHSLGLFIKYCLFFSHLEN